MQLSVQRQELTVTGYSATTCVANEAAYFSGYIGGLQVAGTLRGYLGNAAGSTNVLWSVSSFEFAPGNVVICVHANGVSNQLDGTETGSGEQSAGGGMKSLSISAANTGSSGPSSVVTGSKAIGSAQASVESRPGHAETSSTISRDNVIVAAVPGIVPSVGGMTAVPGAETTASTDDPGVFEGEFAVAAGTLPEKQPSSAGERAKEYAAATAVEQKAPGAPEQRSRMASDAVAAVRIGPSAPDQDCAEAVRVIAAPVAQTVTAQAEEPRGIARGWKAGTLLALALVSQSWRGRGISREQ
jgi:hypothetical protein